MAKFNPTITAYWVPYIIEGLTIKKISIVLLKVELISYTMGTSREVKNHSVESSASKSHPVESSTKIKIIQ